MRSAEDFNNSSEREWSDESGKRILYHCLYREPEGEYLQPTCVREVNGQAGCYLFAATHLSKALAFSFSYHDDNGEIICNGGIEGTDDEFAIICNRSKTLYAPRHIKVYLFPDTYFEQAGPQESRQCVSTRPVAFKDATLVLETSDINDLMVNGLQIFSTEKSLDDLLGENFLGRSEHASSTEQWLHSLAHDDGFVWENLQREINPTQKLVNLFDQYSATNLVTSLNP